MSTAVDACFPQPTIDPTSVTERLQIRGFSKFALMVLTTFLLLGAFPPLRQFYLSWLALVPWLLVIATARSTGGALLWGWLGGVCFFLAGFSYLFPIHILGTILLAGYLALFWATVGATIRSLRLLQSATDCPRRMLLGAIGVAIVWTSFEWLRGNLGIALPLYFLGHAQTPLLPLCQIADLTGAYGVSFVVALVNALIVQTILLPAPRRRAWPAWTAVGGIILAIVGYGFYRMSQDTLTPGPRVLVIQPNDRDFADKTTLDKQRQYIAWHLEKTREPLQADHADLIVWSETTMPSLNPEPRQVLRSTAMGNFLEQVHGAISSVATTNDAGVIVGGYFVGYLARDGKSVPTDYRNAAYFYDRTGAQTARYDKIHLAPFGEYIPLRSSIPSLHRILARFSPNKDEYTLTPGPSDALTVFTLTTRDRTTARIVAPICFDDLDARLISRMFRDPSGNTKRADLIVNLTNDGWFRWFEQQQHLQAAVFRSIENRAPTARAVNTGVSGFIDSVGRTHALVPASVEGASIHQIQLDRRVTFYTRLGDVFAFAVLTITAAMIVTATLRLLTRNRGRA